MIGVRIERRRRPEWKWCEWGWAILLGSFHLAIVKAVDRKRMSWWIGWNTW